MEDIHIRVGPDSEAEEDSEVDLSLRDSRSTVQLPRQEVTGGEITTTGTDDSALRSLQDTMAYLVQEMKSIKLQLHGEPVSLGDEEADQDNSSVSSKLDSVSSKLDGIKPLDHGRWKAMKISDMAVSTFTQSLKDLDIANNEDNWIRWDSDFHSLVESLELDKYVFGDPIPGPTSIEDLLSKFANGDPTLFADYVLPKMHQDLFGKVSVDLEELRDVEIVNEEEKRRFEASKVLLFSILSSCTSSPRLQGIMDRDGARESKNISLMYKFLKCHFVQRTGASLAQQMLKLASIARFNPDDHGSVKAIQTLRDSRRALAERKMGCPDVFLVGLFLCTLEPNSTIKERLQIMVSDAGDEITLESVITVFQTWLRDQEIQKDNDSSGASFRPLSNGKPPRNPKAFALTMEDEKLMKGCMRMKACYKCFKDSGDMGTPWEKCEKHNPRG